MAKMVVNGAELLDERIGRLQRDTIRQIVQAGAGAAVERMKDNTRKHGHVRTGDMLNATGASEYHEFYNYGSQTVYPQGNDRKGVRNADKAYVINYGRGKAKGRLGDKFITADEPQAEEIVRQAMQAESDRLVAAE